MDFRAVVRFVVAAIADQAPGGLGYSRRIGDEPSVAALAVKIEPWILLTLLAAGR
jgi:hypothetical protein